MYKMMMHGLYELITNNHTNLFDRCHYLMVVWFISVYAVNIYPCWIRSLSCRDVLDKHYVSQFVGDSPQAIDSSANRTDHYNIRHII